MELVVTPAFPTFVDRLQIPAAEGMNRELQELILTEESSYSSLGHSHIEGWHSRTDFLHRSEPAVSALSAWLTWALRRMIDATAGPNAFQGSLCVSAWTTICRTGANHAPHSHPDSAWSGVHYVDAGTDGPGQPLSGGLEFLDPRAGVEAVTAPGDPYGAPFRVRPQPELLAVFPSWLYHWVHSYNGQTPRIAISFNASLAPVVDVNAPKPGLRDNAVTVAVTTNELSATACPNPISIQPARRNHHVVSPIIATCASKILGRISSNVIALPCGSSQKTASRGYAESLTGGNRADPSRECIFPG